MSQSQTLKGAKAHHPEALAAVDPPRSQRSQASWRPQPVPEGTSQSLESRKKSTKCPEERPQHSPADPQVVDCVELPKKVSYWRKVRERKKLEQGHRDLSQNNRKMEKSRGNFRNNRPKGGARITAGCPSGSAEGPRPGGKNNKTYGCEDFSAHSLQNLGSQKKVSRLHNKNKGSRPQRAVTVSDTRPWYQRTVHVKPWLWDPFYPNPDNGTKETPSFNYNRPWPSLEGKDVEEYLRKEMKRGRRAELPRITPDLTPRELCDAALKYSARGEGKLFETRKAILNNPTEPKLLILSDNTIWTENEDNAFLNVISIGEIGNIILHHLRPSVVDLTALAFSCKRATFLVSRRMALWDFRLGNFRTEVLAKQEEMRTMGDNAEKTNKIRNLVDTLVVAPFTPETTVPKHPYMDDFLNMMRVCATITMIPQKIFKHVILDQVPFLTTPIVEMIINTMPQLETLTITRCILLDVSKLQDLLDVVERHPRLLPPRPGSRRGTAKTYVKLDWFPFFFHGPDTKDRRGTYGITHHENFIATPKAVFGLVMRHWEQANRVGMDLISDRSAFFSFIRRLPGPDPLWAVKARDAWVTRLLKLKDQKFNERTVEFEFMDDLLPALAGDNYDDHLPRPVLDHLPAIYRHTSGWWRRLWTCPTCKFLWPQTMYGLITNACWSCLLREWIFVFEDSHLRHWQRVVMARWLRDLDQARATLQEALTYRGTLDKALEYVKQMDCIWTYFYNFDKNRYKGLQYFPPPPRPVDAVIQGLLRWTFHFNHFEFGPDYRWDCRHGGPQFTVMPFSDPARHNPTDDYGPEDFECFLGRWVWDDEADERWFAMFKEEQYKKVKSARDRIIDRYHPTALRLLQQARNDLAWRRRMASFAMVEQNHSDFSILTEWNREVSYNMWGLFTPGRLPFNHDQPMPHKDRDPEGFQKALDHLNFDCAPFMGISWGQRM